MDFLECVLPEYGLKISYPTTWEKVNKTNLRPPLVIGFRRPRENHSDPFLESVGIAIIDISSDLVTSPSRVTCDSEVTIRNRVRDLGKNLNLSTV